MTLSENSFKRTSVYVAATHLAFLVGLFVFSRLHFEAPLNPETVVWLDGGGGTGGDGVEAGDAGALPPPVTPRPGSEADSDDIALPPVNRVSAKTLIRSSVEEKPLSPQGSLDAGKSEIQVEAKKPKEEVKKPEVKKPESKPKEEVKKPEAKKPASKPKEEAKKPEAKKPESKPKEEAKKPEAKKPESKPQVVKNGAKAEVAKATAVKSKEGEGKEIPKASAAGSGGAIAKAVSAGGGVA